MLANPPAPVPPTTPGSPTTSIPSVRISRGSPSPTSTASPSASRAGSPRGATFPGGPNGGNDVGGAGTATGKGAASAWGANFWVTIVDPSTQATFYACPATGQTTWDPPENTFLLPPSSEGEWWELRDDSRGGISYFYHTRSGETVWERPDGFVIPLGMIQNSALGKRLSFVAEAEESEPGQPSEAEAEAEAEGGAHSPTPAPAPAHAATTPEPGGSYPPTHAQETAPESQPQSILKGSPPRPASRQAAQHAYGAGNGNGNGNGNGSARKQHSSASGSSGSSKQQQSRPATAHAADQHRERLERPRVEVRSASAGQVPQQQQGVNGTSGQHWPAQQQQQIGRPGQLQPRPSLPNIQNLTAAASAIVSPSSLTPSPLATSPQNGSPSSPLARRPSTSHSPHAYGHHPTGSASSAPPLPSHPSTWGRKPSPHPPLRGTNSGAGTGHSSSTPSSPSLPTSPPSPLFPARSPSPARSSQLSLASFRGSGGGGGKPPSPLRPLPGTPGGFGQRPGTAGAGAGNGRPGTGAGAGAGAKGLSVHVPAGLGIGLGRDGPRQRSATLSSVRSSGISAPIVGRGDGFGELKPPLSPISPFSLRPIPTAPVPLPIPPPLPSPVSSRRLSTGTHPTLPDTLQDDIKRFAASEYARRFFSQRRRGFWFLKRRKVPVDEMMRWQRGPLDGPLLVMNGSLHKDAIAAFKVVQRVMGDRDPLKPVGVRLPSHPSFRSLASSSPSSSFSSNSTGWIVTAGDGTSIIEEERWLLQAGISYIELRDEIYCQVMKQLTENPNTESAFRGWQLLCVLIVTFPPSKYFEDHLTFFLQSSMQNTEGKVDVMAAYCLRRKEIIMWKGPRGKAPSLEEIEAASDAAFHPSVFGESLPLIMSLQATVYPPSEQPVPIILPFLCSGILALGGMKEEGIFRLPGDTDAVASLRLRIERGHYHLEGVEDPHVCASLMKSWLRELREPVIPEGETYNLALQAAASDDPQRVIDIVRHLPEPNRRVLLHVISYLQMFTADEVVEHTKMTEEGLSRVMTPNLIRGRTGDLDVAFRNNHFENIFVGMLLRHMDCSTIDPGYRPMHWRA